jgi:AraC-like DNA-binding protein
MANINLNVLWAASTKYINNWGIKAHKHNCCQIFYIVAGKCQFIVENEIINVGENLYLIVMPDEEHSMQKNHENMIRMIDIKFDITDSAFKDNIMMMEKTGQASEQIVYLFKLISNELKNTGANNKEIIESYLYIILLKMMPAAEEEGPQLITGINESLWPEACRKIAKYVKDNYESNVNLDSIANNLKYNKNYICGIFKRGTGFTIMDYLKMVRIERACELIEMSDYTFQQISLMVGFNSIHNFNRIFKQIMKCTPGQYKAKLSERGAVIQDMFKNEDNYDVV